MDADNRNKSLIKIKILHVNTSGRRFRYDMAHSERNFILNVRVFADRNSNQCPCIHLFWSCLPGWENYHNYPCCACLPYNSKTGKLMPYSRLLCFGGLDISIINMSNTEQWALPASRCRGGHSSYFSLSNYYWASENEEIMYKCL